MNSRSPRRFSAAENTPNARSNRDVSSSSSCACCTIRKFRYMARVDVSDSPIIAAAQESELAWLVGVIDEFAHESRLGVGVPRLDPDDVAIAEDGAASSRESPKSSERRLEFRRRPLRRFAPIGLVPGIWRERLHRLTLSGQPTDDFLQARHGERPLPVPQVAPRLRNRFGRSTRRGRQRRTAPR